MCDAEVPVDWKIIPSVHSEYCKDVVSPMLALLRSAAERFPVGAQDKFVFLSEGHVPVKTFRQVHASLTEQPLSEFATCDSHMVGCQNGKSIKQSSQWIILNRRDQELALNVAQRSDVDPRSMLVEACSGVAPLCLDEYWFMWAVHGYDSPSDVFADRMKLIMGSTQNNSKFAGYFNGQRGDHCFGSTYAYWPSSTDETSSALVSAKGIVEHSGLVHGVVGASTLVPSLKVLDILRRSPFLFARKFGGEQGSGAARER